MANQKGQIALEALLILGVLVIGVIIFSVFYFQSINPRETPEVELGSDRIFKDKVNTYSDSVTQTNPPIDPPILCGNGVCDAGETFLTCPSDCDAPTNISNLNLILDPETPSLINIDFNIIATVTSEDDYANVTKIVITKYDDYSSYEPTTNCEFNGSYNSEFTNVGQLLPSANANELSNSFTFSCNTPGNYNFEFTISNQYDTENIIGELLNFYPLYGKVIYITNQQPFKISFDPNHGLVGENGAYISCTYNDRMNIEIYVIPDNNAGPVSCNWISSIEGDITPANSDCTLNFEINDPHLRQITVTGEDGFSTSTISADLSLLFGFEGQCVLLNTGEIKCFDESSFGQLGNGTSYWDQFSATTVSGINNAINIDTGRGHACAVLSDGKIKCWGDNQYGQLGDGSNYLNPNLGCIANSILADYPLYKCLTPVFVSGISNAKQVSTGTGTSCSVLLDGKVNCWGFPFGNTPTIFPDIENVEKISVGNTDTCVLLIDGTIKCWSIGATFGVYSFSTSELTPITISGISNAIDLSVGATNACVVLFDGTIKCWGRNMYGQLGNNAVSDFSEIITIPVEVSGISNATSVSVGYTHSCALLSDGKIKCWGRNNLSQLGDGTTVNSSIPVDVLNISNVVDIYSLDRGNYNLALLSNGEIKIWGHLNDYFSPTGLNIIDGNRLANN